jgi:hypothetical protein
MKNIYSDISQQLPQLLTNLTARGWDYHFATIPLSTFRPIRQVQASVYDINWGSQWLSPYPGATANQLDNVSPDAFRLPQNYGDFLTGADGSPNAQEQGFRTILRSLTDSSMTDTGFLRSDAMLAVLVVGNGEDTSQVNICERSDGKIMPCGMAGVSTMCTSLSQVGQIACDSNDLSFNYYAEELSRIKESPSQFKFFAAVAKSHTSASQCLAGNAFQGSRYIKMANYFGGSNTVSDICTAPVSNVLTSIETNLEKVKLEFRTHYLFIAGNPDLATLVVTKNSNGQVSTIPQDSQNGWTYEGYLTHVAAIDYPTPMSYGSGYAIELHGSARLLGEQSASVTYRPAGAKDTVAQ